jgi:hypothetical protein
VSIVYARTQGSWQSNFCNSLNVVFLDSSACILAMYSREDERLSYALGALMFDREF